MLNSRRDECLSDEFSQLFDVHGNLFVRFGFFIFEDDVTSIVGGSKNFDHPLQVGFPVFVVWRFKCHFYLSVHGVRSDLFQVAVRVFGAEVSAVIIDAEPF